MLRRPELLEDVLGLRHIVARKHVGEGNRVVLGEEPCLESDFDEDGIHAGKSVAAVGIMNVSGTLRLFVGAE